MADDFVEMVDSDGRPLDFAAQVAHAPPARRAGLREDARLRYVAATRAQRYLKPDGDCQRYMGPTTQGAARAQRG